MKKKLLLIATSLTLCLSLAACGSSYNDKAAAVDEYSAPAATTEAYWGDGYYDNSYSEEALEEPAAAGGNTTSKVDVIDTSRKLIKNYSLSVETENMDELLPIIENEVTRLGGYIENLENNNATRYGRGYRYTNYVIRIPAGLADQFVEFAGNHGNITNKSLSVNDVTMAYVDTEAQRDSLRIQQDRFLELLSEAESIEDILTIEERLTNVRYRLESLESTLRTYDSLVSYSTIRVDISEVVEYTAPEPETYGQRISESFMRGIKNFVTGLQNFSIWFVGALPVLLLWAVIILAMVFVIRAVVKKNKIKAENEKAKAIENIPPKSSEGKTPPMAK